MIIVGRFVSLEAVLLLVFLYWRCVSFITDHHKSGDFPDAKLVCVLEYPEQKGALGKISIAGLHPKIVTKFCQESLGSDDILHITDQEQAHLVPERYHGRLRFGDCTRFVSHVPLPRNDFDHTGWKGTVSADDFCG